MTLYAQSAGILAREKVLNACLAQPLKKFHSGTQVNANDALVGWGTKANSSKLKRVAQNRKVPFIQLEDGFIGYIGHPATKGLSVSIVADSQGIYYDASQASMLETMLTQSYTCEQLARAKALIANVCQYGITKYNNYSIAESHSVLPDELTALIANRPFVLLVDQVAGDQSVAGALADESHFIAMVDAAKLAYPEAILLVRTHPDTQLYKGFGESLGKVFGKSFGKKSGALANLNNHPALQDVVWFDKPCHPHGLIKACEAVFTVSSQMGFEALLYDKPVHCFGMPFYAGWGLTKDQFSIERRQNIHNAMSIDKLAYCALIGYPNYFNPISGTRCEVEEVVELIKQQSRPDPQWNTLYLVGFSLWKRAFMGLFCCDLAINLKFVSKPPKQLKSDEQLLIWGNKHPLLSDVIRVEDGFIRSSGLGSNLCRPSSLVLDDLGMYFNAERNNRLRELLNHQQLDDEDRSRGARLIDSVVSRDINKYNLGSQTQYQTQYQSQHKSQVIDKSVLLVVGQVDGDASIITGSPIIKSNQALLYAVREAHPQAHIIYKPHPDVVAGNREGMLSDDCRALCVDEEITHIGLNQLYPHIDALHTMSSLSGFEALIRGVKVVTWGQPFYAGWGLTLDMNPASDRLRKLTSAELAYITLISYPRYIDWDTGLLVTPEQLIEKMAATKTDATMEQSRLQRWQLKLNYLMETLGCAR